MKTKILLIKILSQVEILQVEILTKKLLMKIQTLQK